MRFLPCQSMFIGLALLLLGSAGSALADDSDKGQHRQPVIIGHRGLLHHAPENTLAGFAACLDLRIGFELDVRRTRDGQLVCLHDDNVKRTTGTAGKVADLNLAELQQLDAGRGFDSAFAGERVPTLEAVFRLLAREKKDRTLVALDLKIDDAMLTTDVVQLAKKHGVLGNVMCIGLAISDPAVRRKLRQADPQTPVAVLANTAGDLPKALADADGDWVYVRFLPTAEQVAQIHRAGKRVFLVGVLVSGREPENWLWARNVGVDALLTDFPLECRQLWRSGMGR